jgi:adenylylsulfate kinase
MNSRSSHIAPVFDRMLSRKDKEIQLGQHSLCLWLTGLSGSGKSTLAIELEKELHNRGFLVKLLDGDNVRTGINNNLGFSENDRIENLRRIAEVNKLFLDGGVITINSFVSPTNDLRNLVKDIIGSHDFFLVYINASLEVCEQRDVKGFYAKARKGEIPDFTGISAPFDIPQDAFLDIDTSKHSVKECVDILLNKFIPLIELK